MTSLRHLACLVSFALLLLAAAARSQQMVLEAAPGVEVLGYCDSLHNVSTCGSFHMVQTAVTLGATVRLGGKPYLVDWMGLGFYLDSGVILEPLGEMSADLKSQRWLEVHPQPGRLHLSSSWQDGDHNRKLSASDTLTLEDGRAVRVRDVRLHLRVSPAPVQ
jgi:hypothetical protein